MIDNLNFKHQLINVLNAKFSNSDYLLTGSIIDKSSNELSDIDVIVVSPLVALMSNEKFYSDLLGFYVDCMIIPKAHLHDELYNSYHSKSGTTLSMIAKGEILYATDETLKEVLDLSRLLFKKGVEVFNPLFVLRINAVKIKNALDDLRCSKDKFVRFTLLSKMLNSFSELFSLIGNGWKGNGKYQAKYIESIAPEFATLFEIAIKQSFCTDVIDPKTIDLLEKELNFFLLKTDEYSTRISEVSAKKLSIELSNIDYTDYYAILKNFSSSLFNGKYFKRIESVSCEYNSRTNSSLILFSLKIMTTIDDTLTLFDELKKDYFPKIATIIVPEQKNIELQGSREFYDAIFRFKTRFTFELLNFLKVEKKEIRDIDCNKLFLFVFSNIASERHLTKDFFKILYDIWLPSAYDVKAIHSVEQLNFEKNKIETHFRLLSKNGRLNTIDFLDSELDWSDSEQSMKILSTTILELVKEYYQLIDSVDFDFHSISKTLIGNTSVDKSIVLKNKLVVEILLNVFGVHSIDRAFLAYLLKS
jgi:hypothetical protein